MQKNLKMRDLILKDEELIAKEEILKKIANDKTGWFTYFIDRDSNRWIKEYINSEYHGGGNPQLRLIEKFPWEESRNYKADFLIAQKVMNEYDPCGLIESETPSDEYDFMTNKVLSFVYNKKNLDETIQAILRELIDNFGIEILENDSQKLKSDIEEVLINVLIELSKHCS
jgi:hypothetical protein